MTWETPPVVFLEIFELEGKFVFLALQLEYIGDNWFLAGICVELNTIYYRMNFRSHLYDFYWNEIKLGTENFEGKKYKNAKI